MQREIARVPGKFTGFGPKVLSFFVALSPIFLRTRGAVFHRGPDIRVDGIWLPLNLPEYAGVLSRQRHATTSLNHHKDGEGALVTSYNGPMIHEVIAVGPLQCNCSIIGDEATREAMVIDPGDDIEDVLALIRKHNLQVKQIVITHAHIDHVGGAMKLRAATGAPILLNQNDYALLKMLDVQATWIGVPPPGAVEIDHSLQSGETVTAGSLSAGVLHTPGHTEGSICLYFPVENKLVAGDTLFAGSIGRTDLPGGDHATILRSLARTLTLPDATVVLPGHGPTTTIGDERQTNPFLTGLMPAKKGM